MYAYSKPSKGCKLKLKHVFMYLCTYSLYFCIILHSIHTDINECSNGTHTCSQTCTNTNGSFTCGCYSGFLLDADGYACNGMQIHIHNIFIHSHIQLA